MDSIAKSWTIFEAAPRIAAVKLLANVRRFLGGASPDRLALPEDLPAAAAVRGRRRKPPPFGQVEAHRHYEVVLCLSGRPRYLLAGRTRALPAGSVVVLPPGTAHAYLHGGDFHHIWLIPRNTAHVNELSCRRGRFVPGGHLQAPLPRALAARFDAALGGPDPEARRLRLFGAVLETAAHLADTAAREPGKVSSPLSAEFLEELLEFIGRNYRKPLKLGDLSEIARLSPAYFSTVFKRQVGCSFKEHLTGVRIEAAKRLLSKTNRTVAEVALAVGYEDPFYFSRAFRKATGLPPSQWRAGR
jgi:AraC-like DNA-binding protein/quercetin dioxygenase-like cupin family protein